MFSGIIEKKAKILKRDWGRFTVENTLGTDLKIGQSIAHDGACMTLESFDEESYSFFVMEESLKKTNYGDKKVWESFNVERCLKVDDRIDGHFVSGHVDTTGQVGLTETQADNSLILGVRFPKDFSHYTIDKWSITINGTSLTIMDRSPWYIAVSLIPLTQDWTNLWELQLGDSVNLEFDMLGKYILNKA